MKRVIIIVFLTLTLAQWSCETTGPNAGDPNIFTRQKEIAMGESLSVEIEDTLELLRNEEFNNYVSSIGQGLSREQDTIPYHFKVIDNDTTVNAFALPGGWIYIYTGLIRRMSNEAELAAVLSHEIAHVVARHSTEQMTRLYGYSVVESALLGEEPGFWEELTSEILSTVGFLHFSRQDEYEADSLGTEYEYDVNYSPEGMVDLLTLLQEISASDSSLLGSIFSTHPPAYKRVDRVNTQIESFPPLDNPIIDTTEFREKVSLIGGTIEN